MRTAFPARPEGLPAGTEVPAQRRGFRLTARVFWDLAIYMVGLGVAVGLVLPPHGRHAAEG